LALSAVAALVAQANSLVGRSEIRDEKRKYDDKLDIRISRSNLPVYPFVFYIGAKSTFKAAADLTQ